MNFFEHQDQAKRNTTRLMFFLVLAVTSLIVMTVLLVAAVIIFQGGDTYPPDQSLVDILSQTLSPELLFTVAACVVAVVALASLYKLAQLSGGGQAVAESMGGKLLSQSSADANERKILNVVEEMAIASGTPVPPVYLLNEAAINAFAAGYQPQDAVIGVTRGCIEILSREELQGVIAHEFSHILHGDMRLNIRLVGILHGILVIGLIGYLIFRSGAFAGRSRSSRSNGGIALGIFGLGAALMVIGYAGTFFGKLIKAAVSRQREYLADASAVQFSRNPAGITGALKKIGGYDEGSILENENAAEFSHMYFGEGVQSFFGLLSTHPPLADRIGRLDPQWKGQFERVSSGFSSVQDSQSNFSGSDQTSGIGGSLNTGAGPRHFPESSHSAGVPSAIDSIGQPTDAHLNYARQLIQSLPKPVIDAARDSFSARALVYNLLISRDPIMADKQREILRENAHPAVVKHTQALSAIMSDLPTETRLPILELSIPAIKVMSERQYDVFRRTLVLLIQADQTVELFEWAIYRILRHNVEPQSRNTSSNKSLSALKSQIERLLSALAHAGHAENEGAFQAFNSARDQLPLGNLSLVRPEDIDFPQLDSIVVQLKQLKPLQKPLLLKAMAACISHDGKVTAEEAELFRAVADSLDCPVPPLLPEQSLR